MNINEELNKELKTKLFKTLAITSIVANVIGFLINILLYGLSGPIVIVGICCAVMIGFALLGVLTKRIDVAAVGIVCVGALFEFPLVLYVYGASSSEYLILAVACIALFLPKASQWIIFGVVFILDVACIIFSYIYPSEEEIITRELEIGSVLWAFCIVSIAMFLMVRLLIGQYEKQREQIVKMTEELEFVAHRDSLTGFYNRRYMMDTLEKWMTMPEKDFVIVHMDIDDFKVINDTYGYAFGDKVITELASILSKNISDKGFACRYSGQEFIALFDGANKEEVLDIFAKVKAEFEAFSQNEKQTEFTFSAGIFEDDKTLDFDEILATVDDRLIQAKRNGKNQIV